MVSTVEPYNWCGHWRDNWSVNTDKVTVFLCGDGFTVFCDIDSVLWNQRHQRARTQRVKKALSKNHTWNTSKDVIQSDVSDPVRSQPSTTNGFVFKVRMSTDRAHSVRMFWLQLLLSESKFCVEWHLSQQNKRFCAGRSKNSTMNSVSHKWTWNICTECLSKVYKHAFEILHPAKTTHGTRRCAIITTQDLKHYARLRLVNE